MSWRRASLLSLWVCQRAAAPFLPMPSSLCSYYTKDRPFLPKGDTPAVDMMPSVLKSLPQLLSAPGMRSQSVFGFQKSVWNAPSLLVKGYPQCFQRMLCGHLGNPRVQFLYWGLSSSSPYQHELVLLVLGLTQLRGKDVVYHLNGTWSEWNS